MLGNYLENAFCVWNIKNVIESCTTPKIILHLLSFDLETYKDNLYVYDGNNLKDHKLGAWTGGRGSLSFNITSITDQIMIAFTSDENDSYDNGFDLELEFICENNHEESFDFLCPNSNNPRIITNDDVNDQVEDGYQMKLYTNTTIKITKADHYIYKYDRIVTTTTYSTRKSQITTDSTTEIIESYQERIELEDNEYIYDYEIGVEEVIDVTKTKKKLMV